MITIRSIHDFPYGSSQQNAVNVFVVNPLQKWLILSVFKVLFTVILRSHSKLNRFNFLNYSY